VQANARDGNQGGWRGWGAILIVSGLGVLLEAVKLTREIGKDAAKLPARAAYRLIFECTPIAHPRLTIATAGPVFAG